MPSSRSPRRPRRRPKGKRPSAAVTARAIKLLAQAAARARPAATVRPRNGKTRHVAPQRKGGPVAHKLLVKAATIADRRRQALTLFLAGADFDSIGETTGVSYFTAWSDVKTLLEQGDEVDKELARMGRQVGNRRLDKLWLHNMAGVQRGDPAAIRAGVAIEQRRARLNGLDAPVQFALGGTPDREFQDLPDDELERRWQAAHAVDGKRVVNGAPGPAALALAPTGNGHKPGDPHGNGGGS